MPSCCPEFDDRHAALESLLAPSPGGARVPELLAYLRETVAALRRAGCGADNERRLVMPAALQLLLSPTVEERMKEDLRRWIEVLSL